MSQLLPITGDVSLLLYTLHYTSKLDKKTQNVFSSPFQFGVVQAFLCFQQPDPQFCCSKTVLTGSVDSLVHSSRSRVKGHLQLYMAYIADDGASNSGASGEQTPEEAGWEVVSIDNSSGQEESPAQVSLQQTIANTEEGCATFPHLAVTTCILSNHLPSLLFLHLKPSTDTPLFQWLMKFLFLSLPQLRKVMCGSWMYSLLCLILS